MTQKTMKGIVGDERLNDPEPFGQFNLGPAAFLAKPRQPLADGSSFDALPGLWPVFFSPSPHG